MSDSQDLLAEAQASDVDKFYLEMGAESSSSDPMAASIAAQVNFAMEHLHTFLEHNPGKPIVLVSVRCAISCPPFRLVLTSVLEVWWYNDSPRA